MCFYVYKKPVGFKGLSVFKMQILWVWCLSLWCCGVGVSCTIVNHGVVFEEYGDLAFSSQTHTLGLVLETTNITDRLTRLSKLVHTAGEVAQEKVDTLTPYFVSETIKIAKTINETERDLSNFIRSFSDTSRNDRVKRFTNLMGYFIGSSLGLATDSEIQDLVKQINQEHTDTHKVLNQVISHLEVTDKQLDRLGKAATQIELAYIGLAHHIRGTDQLMAKLNRNVVLSQSINFMAFAAMNLQAEVAKVLNAIENQVETFRLSPIFLPPDEFLKILVTLQDHVSLLFPPTPRYLSSFYDISKVIVKKAGTRFMFLVRIPLKSDPLKFDLFRLNPLWHSAPNGSAWARKIVLEEEYLAIRKDSKYFTPLKDLGQCAASRSLTVCSPKHGFGAPGKVDCMLALFKNDPSVDSVCQFLYKDGFSPSFVKIGSSWIASSPRTLQANEVCPDKSTVFKIPAGISQITMRDRCQIVGNDFQLPSFLSTQQEDRLIHIIPPLDFPKMPTPTQLQDTLKIMKLDKIGSFTHTQIALIGKHSGIEAHKEFPYRNSIIIILVSLGLVAGLIAARAVVKCYQTFQCCGLSYLRSPKVKEEAKDNVVVSQAKHAPIHPPKPQSKRSPPSRPAPLVPGLNNHRISELEYIEMEMV